MLLEIYFYEDNYFKGHLEVLGAELVAVHVYSRQEDGLHLVVSHFIRGQMGRN